MAWKREQRVRVWAGRKSKREGEQSEVWLGREREGWMRVWPARERRVKIVRAWPQRGYSEDYWWGLRYG